MLVTSTTETNFCMLSYKTIHIELNKFSHRQSIVKYNVGLKTPLQQDISEPVFNGDLV